MILFYGHFYPPRNVQVEGEAQCEHKRLPIQCIYIHTHIYFWHLLYTHIHREQYADCERGKATHTVSLALDMYLKDTFSSFASFSPSFFLHFGCCNLKHLFDGQLEICLPFAIRFSHFVFPQQ